MNETRQTKSKYCPSSSVLTLSDQELDNLGVGCYVKIMIRNNCYWVEIVSMGNDSFTGILHHELNGVIYDGNDVPSDSVEYLKKQIVDLGCDNYCFC